MSVARGDKVNPVDVGQELVPRGPSIPSGLAVHVRGVMAAVAQVVAGAALLLVGDTTTDAAALARWQAVVRDSVADATTRGLAALEHPAVSAGGRRRLATLLLMLADLERCADVAADITRQAKTGCGSA